MCCALALRSHPDQHGGFPLWVLILRAQYVRLSHARVRHTDSHGFMSSGFMLLEGCESRHLGV